MRRVVPYAGSEPYIFFSYAHRNSEEAMPIIAQLTEAGYRVWYDEGIDPGTEWDENIATHVEGCSFFLALISHAYLASDNCKDELNYARDLNKQRVLVYLEQVELPGGMRMRLSRIQAIHKYGYQEEQSFYGKLFSAQGIDVCLQVDAGKRNQPAGAPAAAASSAPHVLERVEIRQMPPIKAAAHPTGFFPTSLLRTPVVPADSDAKLDAQQADKLQSILTAFKAPIWLQRITHGASVSRYELSMGFGAKATTIASRLDNIALELDARSIRMEAPIPGTSLIGLEIPRLPRQPLGLRELLESEAMQSAEGKLPVALGVSLTGKPVIDDLATMPHLILGGVAGSGKTVCLQSIIASLLYRCKPEEVQLVLADLHGVEMQVFNGLSHLYTEVATDPYVIRDLLNDMVREMMNRLNLFQAQGVRNIDGYNAQLPRSEAKMPRIVFIIDELADLMMYCKKDVESAISRLAALSRAAGIHLIIATQRPIPEVLTGLIRASIPARIAFRTATPAESRVLLDRTGAETLLGYGDMLYMTTGFDTPIRMQGCFVTETEIERMADFLRQDRLEGLPDKPTPSAEVTSLLSKMRGLVQEQQELLHQAIDVVVREEHASSSLLQRRLSIGFNRAYSLVEEMERLGVIGPADGAKPRKCLISRTQLQALRTQGKLP